MRLSNWVGFMQDMRRRPQLESCDRRADGAGRYFLATFAVGADVLLTVV